MTRFEKLQQPDLLGHLRVPLGWGIASVLLLGVVFISVNKPDVILEERMRVLYLTAFLYLVALVGWLLSGRKPLVGCWFVVFGLALSVHLGFAWVGQPGFLSLHVLPVLLAQALLSLPAALIVVVAESVLVLLLPLYAATTPDAVTLTLTLIALWLTFALIAAVYLPIRQISEWSFHHYWRAQALLETSRERKAELQRVQDELMLANWQLRLTSERLEVMRSAADGAREAKEAFVAKVSHEFRTPLNMIVGLTDLLLETPEIYGDPLPSSLLEDVSIVQRNTRHLTELIDDVLNLSQAEAGYMNLNREWTDLREDLNTAISVVGPLLTKKRLFVKESYPENMPLI